MGANMYYRILYTLPEPYQRRDGQGVKPAGDYETFVCSSNLRTALDIFDKDYTHGEVVKSIVEAWAREEIADC